MDYFPARVALRLRQRGIFVLTGTISEESVSELCQAMTEYIDLSEKTDEITLLISSLGGSVDAAMCFSDFVALFDTVKIRGIAVGECESAALLILQCCHSRLAMRNCSFLIHHIHTLMPTTYDGSEKEQVLAFVRDGRQTNRKLFALVARRSGIKRSVWRRLADEGERYAMKRTPEEIMRLGLLDGITDAFEVF